MATLKRLGIYLCLGVNIANILLLWGCCASTWIDPSVHPRLTLLGLSFPVFLMVNVAFIFFWIIFYIRLSWVPVVGLLACYGFIRDYIPYNIPQEQPDSCLKIITYNTGNLSHTGIEIDSIKGILMDYLVNSDADIICLQEFWNHTTRTDLYPRMEAAGYEHRNNGITVCFSRLPIVGDTIPMHYSTVSNSGVAIRLLCDGDTILLINNHFESNHIEPEEKDVYTAMLNDPNQNSVRAGMEMMIGKLSASAPYRANQADSIAAMIERYPGDAILVGDFNDTPISYAYQTMARRMDSAWRQSGNGPGWTFNQHGFPIRIDHIFYSHTWTSYHTYVDTSLPYSDHYPVVTHLRKVNKTRPE